METKETFTRGGIRDETVALLYMLHHLIATHSSLLPKLRQVSKLALSSKPSKDLLKGFVGRCCQDVIACRPSSQSEILKASRVLQMFCRDKKERITHGHSRDAVCLVGFYFKQHGHLCTDAMEIDQILVRQLGAAL